MDKSISKIPSSVINKEEEESFKILGYPLMSRGKVRETYCLDKDTLVVVASDRLSIFDFVLPTSVKHKGEVLTAISHFWMTSVLSGYPNHLIGCSEKIAPVNAVKRSLLVVNLKNEMDDSELIFRHHIGGSVYVGYQKTGKAGGQDLEPGLKKWSKLPEPLFTPSTKEDVGHDMNIDAASYFQKMGQPGHDFVAMLKQAYSEAYEYAASRGILILDTKFEGSSSKMIIADEILTPDSSRFVDDNDWQQAMDQKREPKFLDKEIVRSWGKSVETPFDVVGINNLDPTNAEHLSFVHGLKIPEEITEELSNTYLNIFERLTGFSLEQYQKEKMNI